MPISSRSKRPVVLVIIGLSLVAFLTLILRIDTPISEHHGPLPRIESKEKVVVTAAFGYDLDVMSRFAGSLFCSGYNGYLVAAVDDHQVHELHNIFKEFKAIFLPISKLPYRLQQFGVRDAMRYRRYPFLLYVAESFTNPQSLLLYADSRDVFFQDDPFELFLQGDIESHPLLTELVLPRIPREAEPRQGDRFLETWFGKATPTESLYLYLHAEGIRIGTSWYNKHWLERYFGKDFQESVLDKPVINSGVVVGTTSAIVTWVRLTLSTMKSQNDLLEGNGDQGFLNGLYYQGKLPYAVVFRQFNGPILTLNPLPPKHEDFLKEHVIEGIVVKKTRHLHVNNPTEQPKVSPSIQETYLSTGEPLAVIHMWDRLKLESQVAWSSMLSLFYTENTQNEGARYVPTIFSSSLQFRALLHNQCLTFRRARDTLKSTYVKQYNFHRVHT